MKKRADTHHKQPIDQIHNKRSPKKEFVHVKPNDESIKSKGMDIINSIRDRSLINQNPLMIAIKITMKTYDQRINKP